MDSGIGDWAKRLKEAQDEFDRRLKDTNTKHNYEIELLD